MTDMSLDTVGTGTKYLSTTARRMLLALMLPCLGDSLRMVTMVAASREAGRHRTRRLQRVRRCIFQQWTPPRLIIVGGSSCMCSCRWFSLLCFFGVHKVKEHPKTQKARDFNMKRKRPERRTSGLWSDEVLEAWVREASEKVVPAEHTPTTSESKSCLQQCRQEGCSRCSTNPAMTHVRLRLVMYTGQLVSYTRLVGVETAL